MRVSSLHSKDSLKHVLHFAAMSSTSSSSELKDRASKRGGGSAGFTSGAEEEEAAGATPTTAGEVGSKEIAGAGGSAGVGVPFWLFLL